jgi:arsenate reductase-like glutaredoxin family protein
MTVRIKIEDLADPSSFVCKRVKFWFKKHGLSWEDFKANGIDLDRLHELNDQRGMVDKLEATARRRMEREAI